MTRRASKIFEGHGFTVEQVSFAEGTENPKGHCDLAWWAKGSERRGAQAETWVEVKQVMSQECSFYSQYGQQNSEGLGQVV